MSGRVRGTSQRMAVQVAQRRSAGLVLVMSAVGVTVMAMCTLIDQGQPGQVAVWSVLVACWLLTGAHLLRGGGSPGPTAAMLTALGVLAVVVIGGRLPPQASPSVVLAPTIVAGVTALLLLTPGWGLVTAAFTTSAGFVVALVGSGWFAAVTLTALALVFLVGSQYAAVGVRRIATRADARVVRSRTLEMALVRVAAQRSADTFWQGLLHDQIAVALRAAATPGVSGTELRRTARAALDAIRSADGTVGSDVDVMPTLRAVADEARVMVELDAPATLVLPGDAAPAVVGAVLESVRNAERHARASLVHVTVRVGDDGLTVTVRDDGVGFVPAANRHVGGLRVSVLDRMREAGGEAEVTSAPGAGTTVTLRWAPRSHRPGPPPAPLASMARVIGTSTVPVLVAAWALAFLHAPGITWPTLGWLLVVTVITAWAATTTGTRREWWLTPSMLGVVVVGAVVVSATGGPRLGPLGWPVLAAGPVLTLTALRSRWASVAATTALVAGCALIAHGPLVDLVSVLVVVVAMVVVGWSNELLLRLLVTDVAESAAAERAQLERTWRQEVRQQVGIHRRARLESLVVPFLRELASGQVGDDERRRARAVVLEQAVRDEMHLPGVLDDASVAAIRAARVAGCRVRVQADVQLGFPPEPVREMVLAALHGRTPKELTLSVYAAPDRGVVSVVAVPGDPDRRAALQRAMGERIVVLDDDAESTWAEVLLVRSTATAGSTGQPAAREMMAG